MRKGILRAIHAAMHARSRSRRPGLADQVHGIRARAGVPGLRAYVPLWRIGRAAPGRTPRPVEPKASPHSEITVPSSSWRGTETDFIESTTRTLRPRVSDGTESVLSTEQENFIEALCAVVIVVLVAVLVW
jgi:hypothetical protein